MSPTERAAAIIVAAGTSERMAGADKIWAPVLGRPLLSHTVAAFEDCPAIDDIVLVVSAERIRDAEDLARDAGWRKVRSVRPGGARRQDSVAAGVAALTPDHRVRWAAIHDGARPCVTPDLITRGLALARSGGAAIPVVPVADTVKRVGPAGLVQETVSRERLRLAQTPQVFRMDLLLLALARPADVTDDAMLLERFGVPVATFPGARDNLKVTTPEDLALVTSILSLRLG